MKKRPQKAQKGQKYQYRRSSISVHGESVQDESVHGQSVRISSYLMLREWSPDPANGGGIP